AFRPDPEIADSRAATLPLSGDARPGQCERGRCRPAPARAIDRETARASTHEWRLRVCRKSRDPGLERARRRSGHRARGGSARAEHQRTPGRSVGVRASRAEIIATETDRYKEIT